MNNSNCCDALIVNDLCSACKEPCAEVSIEEYLESGGSVEDLSLEIQNSIAAKQLGKLGGLATKKKLGKEHYSRIGKLGKRKPLQPK